ncbi:MAG: hypothetical protein HN778_16900 [Prolixibacteraceae bacterium]|jgi:hypothetical protein|nr:hypothetical protein [Prolixibacteraceae bacterium]MBT6764801.1 hypothetical protein [Prolixibacteraceae bacterium]MBT6997720.1 hypothetical protein [Prolixibacteraceae bacterium]MBT7396508.1 hypothetical protein [Prolixibacteraceae bacterium]
MNKNCKIYLDIDGVLLMKDGSIPDFAVELISFLKENFECYWLTTHCRGGENKAVQYLSKYYPTEIIEKLKTISPAYWNDLKTEVIDFDSMFFWLDDYAMEAEKKVLNSYNKLNSLILVNLKNSNELKAVLDKIKRANP